MIYQPANAHYQRSRTMGHSGGDSTLEFSLRMWVEQVLLTKLSEIFRQSMGSTPIAPFDNDSSDGRAAHKKIMSTLDIYSSFLMVLCRSQVQILLVVFSALHRDV